MLNTWKSIKRTTIRLVFVAALTGWNSSPALANRLMDSIMASWLGATLDDAINQWGFPDEERKIANRLIYVWLDGDGGLGNLANCERLISVDTKEVIKGVDYKGINCPFMEIGPYAKWRKR